MASLRQTQGCALDVQISSMGWNPDGSSSVGKRMDMKSDASLRANRGVPQSGQKPRVARLPLPARTEYVFGVPTISVSAIRTMTPEAKGAPLERWQSRQWQLSIATGTHAHV